MQAIEFSLIPELIPVSMIFILLSSFYIQARCLQVAIFFGAYPHIRPGRRDNKVLYTQKLFIIIYLFILKKILKFFSVLNPCNSGISIAYINKVYRFCSFFRIAADTFYFMFWNFYFFFGF